MPTEFMGRALQRQRDAVPRQMLQELQAIRAGVPTRDEYGLSRDAATRIEQLEQQVGFLAGVVMELCRPTVTQAAHPSSPRLTNRLAVFTCPACQASISRQPHLAGQNGRCPHCGSNIVQPW